MARWKPYTLLGRKVAELSENQAELAELLGVTQQSISRKLRGANPISIKDFERLSQHYQVPMLYFFTPREVSPYMARTLERSLTVSSDVSELLEIIFSMPVPMANQLIKVARVLERALNSNTLDAKQGQGSFDVEIAIRRHVLGGSVKPTSD